MGKRKLDFLSPSQSKLTKLSAFGFSSANSSNVVSETSSSPKPSIPSFHSPFQNYNLAEHSR